MAKTSGRRHPDWLRVKIGSGKEYTEMKHLLRSAKLHTICEEANCPNIAECFGCGTSVFLILGDTCTRNCRYCNVKYGIPSRVNLCEPGLVAESVKSLGLSYTVITSVTRDDLSDGGASMFAETIRAVRKKCPECMIEVLIPDFKGDEDALRSVADASPDVINHNIEVVERLFPSVRPQGNYRLSLEVLKKAKESYPAIKVKSGLMVGLGESWDEIVQTLWDLHRAGVELLTIGQYLQPSINHVPIKRYYTPDEFKELHRIGMEEVGFMHVESGPLVRSSYHAAEAFKKATGEK